MPNILTALHFRPRCVWLLTTGHPRVAKAAVNTAKSLQSFGIPTAIVPDVPAYDDQAVAALCRELARKAGPVLFHVTGGTKLMLLGAFAAARQVRMPAVYLDFRARQLHLIEHQKTEVLPLSGPVFEEIGVRNYLAAHGVDPAPEARIKKLAKFYRQSGFVAEHVAEYHRLFTILRAAYHNDRWAVIRPRGQRAHLLAKLLEWSYLQRRQRHTQPEYRFTEPGMKFLGGPWLEFYVASQLAPLEPDDVAFRVDIQLGGEAWIKTELDLAATQRGRLLIISCKTTSIRNSRDPDAYIDHLDELRALAPLLGGTFCRSLLVTSEDLSHRLGRRVLARAALYQIPILDRSSFPDLTRSLKRILDVS